MNDFLSALEAELTAAARRKAARRAHPWWRRGPRLVLRPGLVAAAGVALLVVALGVAVATLRGGSDRSAQPGPVGSGVPLKALAPVESCTAAARAGADLAPLEETMAVFRRPQSERDALNVPQGADLGSAPIGFLPLSRWSPEGIRRPGLGTFQMPIQLAPGTGTPGAAGCARDSGTTPVVCLLNEGPRPPTGSRCFGIQDIRRGRALALIDRARGVVAGVVPDGVQQVTLEWGGRSRITAVHDSAFEVTLPGVTEGTPVRLRFGGSGCPSGVTDPGLRQQYPALAAPSQGPPLPTPVAADVARNRTILAAEARLVRNSKSVRFWIVPAAPGRCANGRVAGTADRACVLAATASQLLGVTCASVRDAARGSLTFTDRGGGDIVVVGLAPPGTDAAVVPTPRGTAIVPATNGVLGGFLPAGVKLADMADSRVSYRPAGRVPKPRMR